MKEHPTGARGAVLSELKAPDILIGGFPCQGMSVAGKRGGFTDDRSALFFDFIELAKRLRPRWLLIENVPGFLSAAKGRDFRRALAEMDRLGYGISWCSLDAQWRGLAQRRKRVFLVGCLGERCPAEILFEPAGVSGDTPPSRETRKGATGDVAACLNSGGNTGGFRTEPGEHLVIVFDTTQITSKANRSNPKPGDPSPTINANGRHAVFYNMAVRRLMPVECERLQGFPDGWTQVPYKGKPMSDSARYRMLGLAVAVPVVQWILRRLKAQGAQTIGECFSGIGGFALAAQRENMRVLWASEICPQAQAVYAAHFPDVEPAGDIRTLFKPVKGEEG